MDPKIDFSDPKIYFGAQKSTLDTKSRLLGPKSPRGGGGRARTFPSPAGFFPDTEKENPPGTINNRSRVHPGSILRSQNRSWVPKIDFGYPKSILGSQDLFLGTQNIIFGTKSILVQKL